MLSEFRNPHGLITEPTEKTIRIILDLLRSKVATKSAKISIPLLNILPWHLVVSTDSTDTLRKEAAEVLLSLARERTEVGAASAHAFGESVDGLS